jgi:hypothetical protein
MREKKGIIYFLESLVHSRLTEDELNKKLTGFFMTPIKVYNVSKEREEIGDGDGLADWNLMFTSLVDGVEDEKYNPVDGDIYILPMRRDGMMYITEVGYEFI